MKNTADVEFYKRHHGGQIQLHGEGSREVAAKSLLPNGRYGLVDRHFRSGRSNAECVVELGSGNAQSLLLLQESYHLSNVTAVDVAFEDGAEAQGIALRNFNLNETWPFEAGSIDCLIAMMVYEHLFYPFHCLTETCRVLSKDRRAYVNLPLVTDIKNRFRLLAGYVPVTSTPVDVWFKERHWDGNHLHFFSIDLIKRLCEDCGMKIRSIHGIGRFAALKNIAPSLFCREISFELHRA